MSILSKAKAKLVPKAITTSSPTPLTDHWKALIKSRDIGDKEPRVHVTHINFDFEDLLADAQKHTPKTPPNSVCSFLREFSDRVDNTAWLCGSTAHRLVEVVCGYTAHSSCKHIIPKDYDVMIERYDIGKIGGTNFVAPMIISKHDLFGSLACASEYVFENGVTFAILGQPKRGSHTKSQNQRVIVLGIVHGEVQQPDSHFVIDLFSQESASDYLMNVPLAHDGVLVSCKSLPLSSDFGLESKRRLAPYKNIDYIQTKEHSNSLGKQNYVVDRPSSFDVLSPDKFPDRMRDKGMDESAISDWKKEYNKYNLSNLASTFFL